MLLKGAVKEKLPNWLVSEPVFASSRLLKGESSLLRFFYAEYGRNS